MEKVSVMISVKMSVLWWKKMREKKEVIDHVKVYLIVVPTEMNSFILVPLALTLFQGHSGVNT